MKFLKNHNLGEFTYYSYYKTFLSTFSKYIHFYLDFDILTIYFLTYLLLIFIFIWI